MAIGVCCICLLYVLLLKYKNCLFIIQSLRAKNLIVSFYFYSVFWGGSGEYNAIRYLDYTSSTIADIISQNTPVKVQ